jgi:hypothetical protein
LLDFFFLSGINAWNEQVARSYKGREEGGSVFMLVSKYDSRFLLALQIDHSRVAGYLAAHWGNDVFAEPRPYSSVVLAAQEHDNGWWEWEIKPSLNDQGYPLDYITDGSLKYLGQLRLNFYKHGVERLIERDPYAGLIVLMHGIGLFNKAYGLLAYMPDHTTRPDVQEYIRDQEALQKRVLAELRRSTEFQEFSTDEEIWRNFKLMQVYDTLAQFLCNRYPLNNTERQNGPSNTLGDTAVPVAPGKPDVTLTVEVKDETRAEVRPYPFDINPLNVSFPARLVPNRPYRSQEEFLKDFYKAERITVSYRLQAP